MPEALSRPAFMDALILYSSVSVTSVMGYQPSEKRHKSPLSDLHLSVQASYPHITAREVSIK
ncbi:hypothetical protein SM39_pSMC2_68 (plasmid) [Serratia marcescens SM39]|nr:hypothetical protein SM39_pSMC2_68 [Serratia marcescens SM39]